MSVRKEEDKKEEDQRLIPEVFQGEEAGRRQRDSKIDWEETVSDIEGEPREEMS